MIYNQPYPTFQNYSTAPALPSWPKNNSVTALGYPNQNISSTTALQPLIINRPIQQTPPIRISPSTITSINYLKTNKSNQDWMNWLFGGLGIAAAGLTAYLLLSTKDKTSNSGAPAVQQVKSEPQETLVSQAENHSVTEESNIIKVEEPKHKIISEPSPINPLEKKPVLSSIMRARELLKGLSGSDNHEKQMAKIIRAYTGSLRNTSNKGPSVALYLPNKSKINKAHLIQRIQNELNQNPKGLITINMGELKTKDQLVSILQKASPLKGKTLFFEDFHKLDMLNIPSPERHNIIEFMKLIFDTEVPEGSIPHDLKKHYNIDPSNVILAVASNQEVSRMPILKTAIGAPLRDRIVAMCLTLEG
jgi:hypothetical protein